MKRATRLFALGLTLTLPGCDWDMDLTGIGEYGQAMAEGWVTHYDAVPANQDTVPTPPKQAEETTDAG